MCLAEWQQGNRAEDGEDQSVKKQLAQTGPVARMVESLRSWFRSPALHTAGMNGLNL